jgi:RNA polymerase sigma factor (TIGR02999 family)
MCDVNGLLTSVNQADRQGANRLLPLVYDELRTLAAGQIARERPGQTLQPTALVHEAYARLVGSDAPDSQRWAGRGHFFGAAATAMRRILIERARTKGREKRGGGRPREYPDFDTLPAGAPADDLLSLHDALDRLAAADPVKAKLVELRFFACLTGRQAADCLGISPSTAERAWRYARAWLHTAMAGDLPAGV